MNNLNQIRFIFPTHMKEIVKEIMDGEYQIQLDIKNPVICDIGASIGIFSLWALYKWPGCTIHCYEPSPINFTYLANNLGHLPNIKLYNFAIGNPKHTKLFKGKINYGQASFFQTEYQQAEFEIVRTVKPESLPKNCDILKIDTEGCEVKILTGLKHRVFKAILLEYHSEADRQKIAHLLSDYVLVDSHVTWVNQGVLKYIHHSLM